MGANFLLLMGCQQSDLLPTTGDFQPGVGWFDRAMIRLMEEWEIPGAMLIVAEGCDHMIPEKQSKTIIEAVREVIWLVGLRRFGIGMGVDK